jgi:hypothetical protein
MFSRAAVSRYPVNKFGTGRLFAAFLAAFLAADGLLDGFFRESENADQKQKAGMKAGLTQLAVENDQ